MYIETETAGSIGVLRLNRRRTNGLDHGFLSEIMNELISMESRNDIDVIIVTSKLSFGFSSGLDLKSLFVNGNAERTVNNVCQAVRQVYQINRTIVSSRKIYIAALSGPVIGSAASIALSCDLRVADERMWFWLPDPQYGGLLADGGIELLREMVGVSRAKAMLITNRRINAKDLYGWGLLYQVARPERLHDVVLTLGARLTRYSSLTLGITKAIINDNILGDFREGALSEVVDPTQIYNRLRTYLGINTHGREYHDPI